MTILYLGIAFTVLFWFLFFLIVLMLRVYILKMRITSPIITSIKRHKSQYYGNQIDYQDILVGISTLPTILAKKQLSPRINILSQRLARYSSRLYAIIFGPLTYEITRTQLTSALANVSEISRDKFRNNPRLSAKLADILEQLANATLADNLPGYCAQLANYYRMLYFQDTFDTGSQEFSGQTKNKIFLEVIERIMTCLSQNDIFNAYNHLLSIKEDHKAMRNLDDFELILFHGLSSKLDCFVQGINYFIDKSDITECLNDLTSKCDTIKNALISNRSVDILLAAA